MPKTVLTKENVDKLIHLYTTSMDNLHDLSALFKIGHRRVKKIILENNIELKAKGRPQIYEEGNAITDERVIRYTPNNDHSKFVAICKKTNKIIEDPNNDTGILTKHIKKHYIGVVPPKSAYQGKKYYRENKKQWFEEYFDIVEVSIDKPEVRECKLCNWNTRDVKNKSGSFEKHLLKFHKLTIIQYLDKFPEDIRLHPNA